MLGKGVSGPAEDGGGAAPRRGGVPGIREAGDAGAPATRGGGSPRGDGRAGADAAGRLAGRVALDWLNAAIADLLHAEALAAGHAAEADRHLRRAGQAQRQLLHAIKTLATVRRLQLPAVQVNIADQQVNLAT
ncbi:MAG TPA: hypothetical protein VH482_27695 [Thermomicrobiales bacterium]